PRTFLTQGLLSGFAMAAGYGIGAFGAWLWTWMQLPPRSGRLMRIVNLATMAGCAIVAVVSLRQAAPWQNSIGQLMQLEPVETAYPLEVALIALAAFAALIALAWLFGRTLRLVATRVSRVLPARVSTVVGVVAAVVLFWLVIDGILYRAFLSAAEA